MSSISIEDIYKNYWVEWRESERKFYKLLAPTDEEIMIKNLKTRISRGNEYKELGNALFRSQKYNEAIGKYLEAYDQIPRMLFLNHLTDEYSKLALAIISNLCMCFIKEKNFEAAIMQCNEGLKMFPTSVKLRYILGTTLGELERYADAIKVLKNAKEMDPGNRDITEKISFYSKALKEYNTKMKEMFGGKLKPIEKPEIEIEIENEKQENEEPPGKVSTNSKFSYYALGALSFALIAGAIYKRFR